MEKDVSRSAHVFTWNLAIRLLARVSVTQDSLGPTALKVDVTQYSIETDFCRWFYCNNASLTGCPSGSFGAACREKCKCLADHTERCDPKDGTCDCKPGYLGKHCSNSKFSFSNLLQRGVKLRVFSRFFWWKEKLQAKEDPWMTPKE